MALRLFFLTLTLALWSPRFASAMEPSSPTPECAPLIQQLLDSTDSRTTARSATELANLRDYWAKRQAEAQCATQRAEEFARIAGREWRAPAQELLQLCGGLRDSFLTDRSPDPQEQLLLQHCGFARVPDVQEFEAAQNKCGITLFETEARLRATHHLSRADYEAKLHPLAARCTLRSPSPDCPDCQRQEREPRTDAVRAVSLIGISSQNPRQRSERPPQTAPSPNASASVQTQQKIPFAEAPSRTNGVPHAKGEFARASQGKGQDVAGTITQPARNAPQKMPPPVRTATALALEKKYAESLDAELAQLPEALAKTPPTDPNSSTPTVPSPSPSAQATPIPAAEPYGPPPPLRSNRAVKLRTEEALREHLSQTLAAWKPGVAPPESLPFDLLESEFLSVPRLRAERDLLLPLYARTLEQNLSQWENDARAEPNASVQLETLLQGSFERYLWDYSRDQANLSDVLSGKGGNCSAQTKLLSGAVARLRIPLPPGQRYGVQGYRDHVAPVIFQQNADGSVAVRDLVNGKIRNEVITPIFDVSYLVNLAAKSIGLSTRDPNDFLIAKPDSKRLAELKEEQRKLGIVAAAGSTDDALPWDDIDGIAAGFGPSGPPAKARLAYQPPKRGEAAGPRAKAEKGEAASLPVAQPFDDRKIPKPPGWTQKWRLISLEDADGNSDTEKPSIAVWRNAERKIEVHVLQQSDEAKRVALASALRPLGQMKTIYDIPAAHDPDWSALVKAHSVSPHQRWRYGAESLRGGENKAITFRDAQDAERFQSLTSRKARVQFLYDLNTQAIVETLEATDPKVLRAWAKDPTGIGAHSYTEIHKEIHDLKSELDSHLHFIRNNWAIAETFNPFAASSGMYGNPAIDPLARAGSPARDAVAKRYAEYRAIRKAPLTFDDGFFKHLAHRSSPEVIATLSTAMELIHADPRTSEDPLLPVTHAQKVNDAKAWIEKHSSTVHPSQDPVEVAQYETRSLHDLDFWLHASRPENLAPLPHVPQGRAGDNVPVKPRIIWKGQGLIPVGGSGKAAPGKKTGDRIYAEEESKDAVPRAAIGAILASALGRREREAQFAPTPLVLQKEEELENQLAALLSPAIVHDILNYDGDTPFGTTTLERHRKEESPIRKLEDPPWPYLRPGFPSLLSLPLLWKAAQLRPEKDRIFLDMAGELVSEDLLELEIRLLRLHSRMTNTGAETTTTSFYDQRAQHRIYDREQRNRLRGGELPAVDLRAFLDSENASRPPRLRHPAVLKEETVDDFIRRAEAQLRAHRKRSAQ